MKKRIVLWLAVFMLALGASPFMAAAQGRPVTSLQASYASGRVSYGGTAAQGVSAVAALLFAPDGSLLMMDTCEVRPDGSFAGGISIALAAGSYTLKASAYEGGEFTATTFVRPKAAEPDDAPMQPVPATPLPSPAPAPTPTPDGFAQVPQTGDGGGVLWLALMAPGALLGLAGLLVRRGAKRA